MPDFLRPKATRGRSVLVTALVLTASVAASAGAQTGAVRGRVLDDTRQPVSGVRVSVAAPMPVRMAVPMAVPVRSAVSDVLGQFRFDSLAPGPASLIARRAGYEVTHAYVIVRRDSIVEVTLVLSRTRAALQAVVVQEHLPAGSMRPALDRTSTLITAGARSEVIELAGSDANLSEKVGRQIFARVPGIQVYDMDGAGNQTNVSTRGLDPHRSWEMNVRQDGIPVVSDAYGYPASHYSPPLEAMERVALVRGTASLQYGAQFGGLLDYITLGSDTTRAFAPRAVLTNGSFGLRNGFGQAGGRVGSVDYQLYGAWRESDGFRDVSRSRYSSHYASATWRATPTLSVRAQSGRSWYRYRIPGPLTDAMFAADARAATRRRNWFSPTITVPAMRVDWQPRAGTRVSAQVSAVLGDRSSVQFVGFATVADTAATATGRFAARAVDIDDFNSRTIEFRLIQEHTVASWPATLATGIAISDNHMRRRQQGAGTSASDYDLTVSGAFGRDLHYRSRALAFYAEEMVQLSDAWSLIPGVRIESGRTRMSGRLAYYDPADVPRTVRHDYPLFGLRAERRVGASGEFYAGWSQAYRPMLLKDLLPENALEVTDTSMRDARGWTVEAGVRGRRGGRIGYDIGAFWMRYDGRSGALFRDDGSGPYLFKTNLGSTRTLGVELSVDALLRATQTAAWRGFIAGAFFDAVYREGIVVAAGTNASLEGKTVEGVPRAIVRTGITRDGVRSSLNLQVSHTARTFGDPLNTVTPNATGARGLVPAYTLVDANGSVRLSPWVRVRFGVTNLLDARYFTKRPAFYPGPGVWPSDGIGVQAGVELGR